MSRTRNTACIAVAAAAAMVLTGCSSSASSAPAQNNSSSESTPTSQSSSGSETAPATNSSSPTTESSAPGTSVSGTSASSGSTSNGTSTGGAPPKAGQISGSGNFLACMVTDTGGINDRSFNESAYNGLKQAAKADSDIEYTYLQSNSTSDYVPNIQALIRKKCNIIVTVGYDMAKDTLAAAKKNPNTTFTIVDYSYKANNQKVPDNLLALHYDANQGAFLGGYLAAAMSKTGKIGTFGGQDIPTVTIYMDGWVAGTRYYDKVNNKHVKVLGFTPATSRTKGSFKGKGLFTNNFTSASLGRQDAQALMAQGADVIFPVAGAVGLGAAAAVKQKGSGYTMEWVDTDGCVSAQQYCSLFLTSVIKGIVPTVKHSVLTAAKSTFQGGQYNGTLQNGGAGISPFHTFADKIPSDIQQKLTSLKTSIISGKISVDPDSYPAG